MEAPMPSKIDVHAARNGRIVQLYQRGMTTYQIADQVGVTRSRVSQILHQHRIETRPRGFEKAPRSRLHRAWSTD